MRNNSRRATKSELLLISFLIKKANLDINDGWQEDLRVTPMGDGGMGSLILNPDSDMNSKRIFGRQASECRFIDEDGVDVLVTLNLDKNGGLFELDVWKVNFEPLRTFPSDISEYLKQSLSICKTAQWTDPYLLTGAIHIGISNISPNPVKGFKEHGLHRTINRGFKPKIILSIVEEGNVTHAKGRYGRPQTRYRLGNNVVILDEHGKIITVYGPKPTGNYKKQSI